MSAPVRSAGRQPLPRAFRALAQEQMRAGIGDQVRRERVAASIVDDARAGPRQAGHNIARDGFVVHALVARIDVDRRCPVPVFSPGHDAQSATTGFRSCTGGCTGVPGKTDPSSNHERGAGVPHSVCRRGSRSDQRIGSKSGSTVR